MINKDELRVRYNCTVAWFRYLPYTIRYYLIKWLGGVINETYEYDIAGWVRRKQYWEDEVKEIVKKTGTVIDERNIFFDVDFKDGRVEHCCDEEKALAVLLAEGILDSNEREYVWRGWNNDEVIIEEPTTLLFVNCNDLFWWATGDAEPLPHSEIGRLYKIFKEHGYNGVNKWCCLRRNLRPQIPIVKRMKQEGFWDAELEALPAPEPS